MHWTDQTELILPTYFTNSATDGADTDLSNLTYCLEISGFGTSASAPAPDKHHICVPLPHMRRHRVYRRAPERPPFPTRGCGEERRRCDPRSRSGVDG